MGPTLWRSLGSFSMKKEGKKTLDWKWSGRRKKN
jgi:hypothetical protein